MRVFRYLTLIAICFLFVAGHAVTINVDNPGNLTTLLTSTDKTTITDLTLTGNIDVRDFKCLRDELTVLSTLDMSLVNIMAYSGTGGTTSTTVYLSNQIPENAFYNNKTLTKIVFPTTLTAIQKYAFTYTSKLTSANISSSVLSVDESAFEACYALNEIVVDAANPNYSSLDGVMFNKNQTTIYRCPAQKKGVYAIPSTVTYVYSTAFKDCSNLTEIDLSNVVNSIGTWAFANCTNLQYVSLPNALHYISGHAFFNCSSLSSIEIPNNVTAISDYTFCNCVSLKSAVLPTSIKTIGNQSFFNCPKLVSLNIPNSVTSIGNYAFSDCVGSGNLVFPNTLKTIGEGAFSFCSGFTGITFNNSITSIGNGAFSNCTGITGTVEIPNTLTKIGCFLFRDCKNLQSVKIPNSVTVIDNFAFDNCNSLNGTLLIPGSVTSIGESAFSFCQNLEKLIIPSSVKNISRNAFWGCKNLNEIQCFLNSPIDLSSIYGVFMDVNKSVCILKVPSGSEYAYHSAYQWKDFKNIAVI